MNVIDKFALRYYGFLPVYLMVAFFIYYLHDSLLAFLYIGFHNSLTQYLFKDENNQQSSKELNKNSFQNGPLILSCLCTPLMMCVYWNCYDQVVGNSPLHWFFALFTLSFTVGASIDASHELIHRNEYFCKVISYVNLWFYQFTVYPIEHLYMHHKKVGTPDDPVTSQKNQSIYTYYVNVIASAYKFNFNFNKFYFALCVASTLSYNLLVIGLSAKHEAWLGRALFFISFSYMSLFLMECVEYIEHYGLIYRKDKDDPINELCAWNSMENGYANLTIFRFQRHSDHHMNAYKVYSTLDLNEKMPMFPFSFLNGIIFCLTPSKWYEMMNPLVDKYLQGKTVSKEHYDKIKKSANSKAINQIVMFGIYVVIKIVI